MTTQPFFNEPYPYKGEIIHIFTKSEFNFLFTAIHQHLDFLKKSMEQEKELFENTVSQIINEMDFDSYDEMYAHKSHLLSGYAPLNINSDIPSAINTFEQIQWRSNFIFLYSIFEHILNQICYEIENNQDVTVKPNSNRKDKGIEKAKKYLENFEIKTPFQTTYWERAELLRSIRNKIVHANSEVKKDNELIGRLKNEKNITLSRVSTLSFPISDINNHEISLTYEFVKQSVTELQKVVMDICNYPLYSDKI